MADSSLPSGTLVTSPDLRAMADAWIDRFEAIGGYFGYVYNTDGTPKCRVMGHPMPYVWEPPVQQNLKLCPSEQILEGSQHEGAVKMLYSFLALVPGLRSAVYDLAHEYGLLVAP